MGKKYILKVLAIREDGKRSNQEDTIYPSMGSADGSDRLFIVCDGMGGHDCGEIASATVCEAMSRHITSRCSPDGSFTEADFNAALDAAYDALDAKDNGAGKKMGTTMTFLKFHPDGCMIAHIGDSRVYHIRPSASGEDRICHVTRDHSLVNALVALGEMTPEQAKTSNQKNVITRAMQPHQETRARADIMNVSDIRKGDYFYMCTDGMLEVMDDMELADILSYDEHTDEEKVEILIDSTKENRDNHSAYIVHVLDVMESDNGAEVRPVYRTRYGNAAGIQERQDAGRVQDAAEVPAKKWSVGWVIAAAVGLIMLGVASFLITSSVIDKEDGKSQTEVFNGAGGPDVKRGKQGN